MHVHERRPSGLAPRDLLSYGRARRSEGRSAAVRLIAAVVLMVAILAPLGILWFVLGFALLASLVGFVRRAAVAALARPALVLTGTPKWEGTRRVSWMIEADDDAQLVAAASALTAALSAELGTPVTAVVDDDGSTVSAWGVGRAPRLAADGATDGVWLRIDPPADDAPISKVTVLCNEGAARAALVRVASLV